MNADPSVLVMKIILPQVSFTETVEEVAMVYKIFHCNQQTSTFFPLGFICEDTCINDHNNNT